MADLRTWRTLRRRRREREALLLDLGALVYELHRQGERAPGTPAEGHRARPGRSGGTSARGRGRAAMSDERDTVEEEPLPAATSRRGGRGRDRRDRRPPAWTRPPARPARTPSSRASSCLSCGGRVGPRPRPLDRLGAARAADRGPGRGGRGAVRVRHLRDHERLGRERRQRRPDGAGNALGGGRRGAGGTYRAHLHAAGADHLRPSRRAARLAARR